MDTVSEEVSKLKQFKLNVIVIEKTAYYFQHIPKAFNITKLFIISHVYFQASSKFDVSGTARIGANSTIVENTAEAKPIYENHQQQPVSPKTPTTSIPLTQQPVIAQTAGTSQLPGVDTVTVHEPIASVAPEHGNAAVVVAAAAITAAASVTGAEEEEDFVSVGTNHLKVY